MSTKDDNHERVPPAMRRTWLDFGPDLRDDLCLATAYTWSSRVTASAGVGREPGDQLGRWRLIDQLGQGGNGEVWRCVGPDRSEAAIKVLLNQRSPERLGRFRNEIAFLLGPGQRPGVVPILDHDLSGAGRVWYVMPLAVPIRAALGPGPAPDRIVEAIAAITRTLAGLAKQRDSPPRSEARQPAAP